MLPDIGATGVPGKCMIPSRLISADERCHWLVRSSIPAVPAAIQVPQQGLSKGRGGQQEAGRQGQSLYRALCSRALCLSTSCFSAIIKAELYQVGLPRRRGCYAALSKNNPFLLTTQIPSSFSFPSICFHIDPSCNLIPAERRDGP